MIDTDWLDEHYFNDLLAEWYGARYPFGVRVQVQEREHLARFLAQRTKARAAARSLGGLTDDS